MSLDYSKDLPERDSRQLVEEVWELVENGALVGVDFVVLRFGRGPAHYQYTEDLAVREDVPALIEHAAKSIRAFLASRAN